MQKEGDALAPKMYAERVKPETNCMAKIPMETFYEIEWTFHVFQAEHYNLI